MNSDGTASSLDLVLVQALLGFSDRNLLELN